MWVTAVAAVVAGAVRVLWWIIAWRMEALRERERCRAVVALLGAAGSGAVVSDRRGDGSVLMVLRCARDGGGRARINHQRRTAELG